MKNDPKTIQKRSKKRRKNERFVAIVFGSFSLFFRINKQYKSVNTHPFHAQPRNLIIRKLKSIKIAPKTTNHAGRLLIERSEIGWG